MGDEDSDKVAKKTFIIVGGSDALMLLGVGIIYYLSGTFQMDRISIPLTAGCTPLAVVAYLSLAAACFAKAGAMPLHSWIPDCARSAPLPVVAYLPASLDKLLGIYLLARLSLDLFVMSEAMNIFLMLAGAFTIIAAVMMALLQHNLKRLLGYHAVSQVGYMVLGIGTGNPIGIAGGLFHMLNHAIYKSCLFFTAGNVEKAAKSTELDELGGLSRFMPITYLSCLIASLAISGVPPFNGFVSKWMIYQGLISNLGAPVFKFSALVSILCLAAAMFGSALTLASFMKLLHATFLGRSLRAKGLIKEADWQMWLPAAILALLCVLFGVLAYQLPLKYFIFPAVPGVVFIGSWLSSKTTLLIIAGLAAGLLLFAFKPKLRRDKSFLGAETRNLDLEASRVSGTDFYNTVREFAVFSAIYKKAEGGFFDIYEQGKAAVFAVGKFFQFLHNGVLPTYLVWTLLGMIGLFFALVR
jgi:formate hydrogenlyase subunit 3/multisubunit Na+/H+ antiporter MnhD subunit